MVRANALPEVVHEVQVRRIIPHLEVTLTVHHSYIVAAALDGGTQVISFILNFVSLVPFPHYDTD